MRVQLAREGGYFEDRTLAIELHWGRGGGERQTAQVPDDRETWSRDLTNAFETGVLVELPAEIPAKPLRARRGATPT